MKGEADTYKFPIPIPQGDIRKALASLSSFGNAVDQMKDLTLPFDMIRNQAMEAAKALAGAHTFFSEDLQRTLKQLSEVSIGPVNIQFKLAEAMQSLALETTPPLEQLAKMSSALNQREFQFQQMIDASIIGKLDLENRFADLLRGSLMCSDLETTMGDLSHLFPNSDPALQALDSSYFLLNQNFRKYVDALTSDYLDSSVSPQHDFLTTLPSKEIVGAQCTLHAWTEANTDDHAQALEFIDADDAHHHVQRLLTAHFPDLVDMWIGALDVIKKPSRDAVRHFGVSCRELLTQLLRRLAPDNQVRIWTSDPSCFHNDRPTRRTRLLFICDAINKPPFTELVQSDVQSALKLLDLLQNATHAATAPFELTYMRVIRTRVCNLIVLLIATAYQDE